MGDIISYVYEFGGFTFAEKPFCEVDGLLFSHFSYFLLDKIIPHIDDNKPAVFLCDAAQQMDWHNFISVKWELEKNRELFYKAAFSRRYRNTKVNYFLEEMNADEGVQFCAVTFMLGNGDVFVSFRGTDDALVGWKEDFYMAYRTPVGAQLKSTAYLNRVAKLLARKRNLRFYLGGHSKGGNLAVYAAMTCEDDIKPRIGRIFNMDGPGFRPDFMDTLDYDGVKDKILKIVPDESFVGLLMEQKEDYELIQSTEIGVQQHVCFSWCIEGDRFVRAQEQVPKRKELYDRINNWIFALGIEQVGDFIDSLFKMIEITEAKTLTDLKNVKGGEFAKKLHPIVQEYSGMNEETKQVFWEISAFMVEILTRDQRERISRWKTIEKIRQKMEH
ncbi:MAG: DUF2974 domain-containing protein [Lachnospiraceae bacterium]|nr:DUF2974 domain-containing protein [Lachnospiraceae bacterium]